METLNIAISEKEFNQLGLNSTEWIVRTILTPLFGHWRSGVFRVSLRRMLTPLS